MLDDKTIQSAVARLVAAATSLSQVPDSTQYARVGGTRQSDRKTGGRRAKIATLPHAA